MLLLINIVPVLTEKLKKGSGNAFESDDTKNYGGYIEIKNNGSVVTASSTTTAEDLFKASVASGSVIGMRSVNLKDIKGTNDDSNTTTITTSVNINGIDNADKRKGLFRLDQYDPDIHGLNYSGHYWLASPHGSYGKSFFYHVSYYGAISFSNDSDIGIRPVISISNVKLQLKGNVWKIVE